MVIFFGGFIGKFTKKCGFWQYKIQICGLNYDQKKLFFY